MNKGQSLLHSISVNDEGKLIWSSTYECFKQFVEEVLNLSGGKWSSPGRDTKQYESEAEDILIKWRAKTQTIVVSGKNKDYINDKLMSAVSVSKTVAEPESSDHETFSSENINPLETSIKSLNGQMQALKEELTDNLIAINRSLLEHSEQLKELQSPNTDNELCRLKLENSDLKEENDRLTERINNLSFILADLQGKAKCAEEEKASLITTIRLLYKDLGGNQPVHAHYHSVETTQPSNQPLLDQTDGDKVLSPQQKRSEYSVTPTQNSFSVLNVEEASDEDHQTTSKNTTQKTRSHQNNQGEGTKLSNNDSQKENYSAEGKSTVVLVGDSMVKNINPRKLSRKRVNKFTFPGKRAEEIAPEIKNINMPTDSRATHVIIHAGTNNLPTDTGDECIKNIKVLCASVKEKFPKAKIGVSGIVLRKDIDISGKTHKVNEQLKLLCDRSNLTFIDNSIIDESGLNNSKLHLSAKGSAILATRFIKFLNPDRKFMNQSGGNQAYSTNFFADLLNLIALNTPMSQRRQTR